MTLTRRTFLQTLAAVPAAAALSHNSALAALVAPPGAGTRKLVMVDLKGGNDGLNTIVPFGLDGGTYGSVFRPTIGVPTADVLEIDTGIGMHPSLAALKGHFDAGRLSVVQGVSYPDPNFSHEYAQRIWQTGDPTGSALEGWLGRALALCPEPASPHAASLTSSTTLLLAGTPGFVPAFTNLGNFDFPVDKQHKSDKANREAAYAAIAAGLDGTGGRLGAMAQTGAGILDLIALFDTVPAYEHVGDYPDAGISNPLRLVARLLAADIGMQYFHVTYGGFDHHSAQNENGKHANKLYAVSEGVSALYDDLAALGLADDCVIVVFSEFGRTVYENGSAGTDHGSTNPVLVLGDAAAGGLVSDHPSMDPADLDDDGELPMVVDVRDVLGTIAQSWLAADPAVVFPGHAFAPVPIFT